MRTMRVLIAPDKFKGSLTAPQAAEAMARGVRRILPNAEVSLIPLADGGEGTIDAMTAARGGEIRRVTVTGPMGQPVEARYGSGKVTAYLEMAEASGLSLVPPDQRNPWLATTYGTGELIRAAVADPPSGLFIGIGGSATNDGGAGMAQALGFRLLDFHGEEIPRGGGSLDRLWRIDDSCYDGCLVGVNVEVACDVTNPLCGPNGASAVYGPQKGATPEMVEKLDRNLAHFAAIIRRDLGVEVADEPGAGAAGGLGAGLIAFADARLGPGFQFIEESVGLAAELGISDLCLTGEGSIDGSTGYGKVVAGVGSVCRSVGVPCIALAGSIGEGAEVVHREGVDAVFSLCHRPMSLAEALDDAAALLEAAAEQAVRAFLAGRRGPQS